MGVEWGRGVAWGTRGTGIQLCTATEGWCGPMGQGTPVGIVLEGWHGMREKGAPNWSNGTGDTNLGQSDRGLQRGQL